MSSIQSSLLEETKFIEETDTMLSEIDIGLDEEVKDCVTGNYILKEYFDDDGVYHFRLCNNINDLDKNNWEAFDYGSDSALLDIEFLPEEI